MNASRRIVKKTKALRRTLGLFSAIGTTLILSACSMDEVLRPSLDVGAVTAGVSQSAYQQAAPLQPAPLQASQIAAPIAATPFQDGNYGVAAQPSFQPYEPAPQEIAAPLMIEPQPMPNVQMAAATMTIPRMPAQPAPAIVSPMPQIAPTPSTPGISMSQNDIACRKELKRLRVVYRDLPPINDGGHCAINRPVSVSSLSGGIKIKPAATLTCDMAVAFAQWTKQELAPNARMKYLSGVDTIHQGSSYSCRKIRGTTVASEHSKGNAIDIMKITLNSGRVIDVRKPGLFAFRQRSLLNTVRADGCNYFSTVLGPGYDRDHADHFHFDIKNRKNGYRACR